MRKKEGKQHGGHYATRRARRRGRTIRRAIQQQRGERGDSRGSTNPILFLLSNQRQILREGGLFFRANEQVRACPILPISIMMKEPSSTSRTWTAKRHIHCLLMPISSPSSRLFLLHEHQRHKQTRHTTYTTEKRSEEDGRKGY